MEVDKSEGFEPVVACSHFCSYMERTKIPQATQFSQKNFFLMCQFFKKKITRTILKCEYLRVIVNSNVSYIL